MGKIPYAYYMNKNTKRKKFNPAARKAARTGKNALVSFNARRNMAMRVFVNEGDKITGNRSLTVHEPYVDGCPSTPHKHRNYEEREGRGQPRG